MSSQELVKNVGARGLASFNEAADVFAHEAVVMGVQNGSYLSFSGRTGLWKIKGQDVDEGTCFAFHILHCQKGVRAWKNDKVVEQHWTPFVNGDPLPEELTDHWKNGKEKNSDGWQECIKIDIRDLEGGPQMDFTLPSDKPWRPVWRLIKEFGDKAKLNKDDAGQYKIPVIEIGSELVNGKSGNFFSPKLTIVDWITEADMADRVQEFVAAHGGDEVEEAEIVEEVAKTPPPAVSISRAPVRSGVRK